VGPAAISPSITPTSALQEALTSGCERGIKCGVDGLQIVTDSLRLPVAAVVVQVFGGGRIVSDGLVFRSLTA